MKKNYFYLKRECELKRNLIKIMKLTLTIMLAMSFNVYSTVYSQNVQTSINLEDSSVEDFIKEIGRKTGVRFIYNSDDIKNEPKIDINVSSKYISDILRIGFKKTNLDYEFYKNAIIIKKKAIQNKYINQRKISGRVLNTKGQALAGVTVMLKGGKFGTSTDLNGYYKLSIPDIPNQTLIFSFIGKQTKEIKIGDNNEINIRLLDDSTELGDVVVTGIFNKPRESYTGAVSTISGSELKMYKGQNILQTLKNIDPSINIQIDNSAGSDPNHLPIVTIRGNSSLPMSIRDLNDRTKQQLNAPLVIMDGFEVSIQKLMDFSDEEIESINIMKDAAATAIYGSRGANGVIVVTTKSPKTGKLRVYFRSGINFEFPDLSSYNLMNASEKLELEYKTGLYNDPKKLDRDIELKKAYNKTLADVISGVDTYWISQPLRTGVGKRYNARLEGGSREFRWSASLDYNKILGAMKGSERSVFNGAINLSYTYKNLIFKNQTRYYTAVSNRSEDKYGSFYDYSLLNPYWKIRDSSGKLIKYYQHPGGFKVIANPLYNAELNVINSSVINQITNNFSLEWAFTDDLRLNARIGISKSYDKYDKFKPASHIDFIKYDDEDKTFRKGSYNYGNGEGFNYDGNITMSYSKYISPKHLVYVGFDYSISQHSQYQYNFMIEGFSNDNMDFLVNGLQFTEGSKPSGFEATSRSVGFTLNTNYTYDNRYFADFSYRLDGSSQFGSNNRFAPFWSLGIGWNVHNEKFINDNDILTELRIRGSIGQNGSQQFEPYRAIPTLKYYSDKKYMVWNAATLMGLGNKNLKWQITEQMNFGTDISLFNNRLRMGLDIYSKKTSNLLSQMDLPNANGFNSYTDNVGEVKNFGFEASLGGSIIADKENDFTWNLNFRMAYNEDKITKLSDAIKKQTEEYIKQNTDFNRVLFEGYSQNAIYAVRSLGIDPSTGKEVFLNKHNEITNVWNPSDKVYAGIGIPKYRGSINSLISYKNWYLNLSFGYHWGGQQYNNTLISKVEVNLSSIKYNVDKRVLNERWFNPGDVKFFKAIGSEGTRATTRFVMDDRVFTLQSAALSYKLESEYLKSNLNIHRIDFGINMSDVFYISSIKRERGTTYPFARRVDLSISLLF